MNIENEIKSIFTEYVKIPSYTNTSEEKKVTSFLNSWFEKQEYFLKNPEFWGNHPVEKDPLDRHVIWGMVKGTGNDTIVMIHHYDVVEIEDYETAKPYAHDVHQINRKIQSMHHKFDPESAEDLESGQWQFGRGVADMKAGGAIQLALLKQFGMEPDFPGNVIVLCLPDEENLSAGMRSGITLLSNLKQRFQLNYLLMINSEPHQSTTSRTSIIYEGSVGKLMPIVCARGSLAHVGRIYEGLNPLHLMSQFVIDTELNMNFSDIVLGEATPPPTWLYLKDRKNHYDVSIPTTAWAYLSVMTLKTQPDIFLEKFKLAAEKSFQTVINRMNFSYEKYLRASNQPIKKLPWSIKAKTFYELFSELSQVAGDDFIFSYREKLQIIDKAVADGKKSLVQSSFELIEFCLQYFNDKSPLMIIGLSPPYYPHMTNRENPDLNNKISQLTQTIHQFSMDQWQQPFLSKNYYTGISDLSYSSLSDMGDSTKSVEANMPLWGDTYQIPFEKIRQIGMPCLNIGPWGKDFHKLTERVLIKDLYKRTPKILDYVIRHLLS